MPGASWQAMAFNAGFAEMRDATPLTRLALTKAATPAATRLVISRGDPRQRKVYRDEMKRCAARIARAERMVH